MLKKGFVLTIWACKNITNSWTQLFSSVSQQSVTQGVSKVSTLPQPVSCASLSDGSLYHYQFTSQPASRRFSLHLSGQQAGNQASLATSQSVSDLTRIKPAEQFVNRPGKSVQTRGGLASEGWHITKKDIEILCQCSHKSLQLTELSSLFRFGFVMTAVRLSVHVSHAAVFEFSFECSTLS